MNCSSMRSISTEIHFEFFNRYRAKGASHDDLIHGIGLGAAKEVLNLTSTWDYTLYI